MESKFVIIQGKKLHYKSYFDQNEKNKPVFIFIHGASPATQHTEFWVPLLAIIQKYCQPVLLDGYGHGLSAKPDPQEEVAVDIIL